MAYSNRLRLLALAACTAPLVLMACAAHSALDDEDAGGAPGGNWPDGGALDGGPFLTPGQSGPSYQNDGGTGTASSDGSTASSSHCAPDSPDQSGCACSTAGEKRPCYTGPKETRGIGACHDGNQLCSGSSGGELVSLSYGACTGDSLPSGNNCSTTTPPPPVDPCQQVSGQNGNITTDAGMFCEGDLGGFLGGLGGLGGLLGGGATGGP